MMKTRHLLPLLLTLLLPLVAAGQEVPDTGQQTPAAGSGSVRLPPSCNDYYSKAAGMHAGRFAIEDRKIR